MKSTDDYQSELLDEIQHIAAALEHQPSKSELREYGDYDIQEYRREFDSVEDAIDSASLSVDDTLTPTGPLDEAPDGGAEIPSHTDLLRELAWLSQRHGSTTAQSNFDKISSYDRRDYKVQFGSLETAFDALNEAKTSSADFVPKSALKAELDELGSILQRSPSVLEVLYFAQYPITKYAEKFDSISNMSAAAGYETPSPTDVPSTETLLTDLERSAADSPPTIADYDQHGDYQFANVLRQFDTWLAALGEAGFDPFSLEVDIIEQLEAEADRMRFETQLRLSLWFDVKPILLDELHRLQYEIGSPPTETIVMECSQYPVSAFERAFGSLNEALNKGDLASSGTSDPDIDAYRTRLLESLQTLETQWGHPPTQRMVNALGAYPVVSYVATFGSWESGLQEAGLTVADTPDQGAPILLTNLQRIGQSSEEPSTIESVLEKTTFGRAPYVQVFGTTSSIQAAVDPDTSLSKTGIPLFSNEQETKSESRGPSREELLTELQRLDKELDRTPKAHDIAEKSEFTRYQYYNEFGSWDGALEAADIDKEAYLLNELERVWRKVGSRPKTTQMSEHAIYSTGMYSDFFGSWEEAIHRLTQTRNLPGSATAGEANSDSEDRETMIEVIRNLHDQIGRIPKSTELPEEHAPSDFYNEFGGWDAALEAAGIDKEQAILEDIERVAQKVERVPTTTDIQEHDSYPASAYQLYFDSWDEALERSGVKQRFEEKSEPQESRSREVPEESDAREEMLKTLQSLHGRLDRIPEPNDLPDESEYARHEFYSEFGSWDEALEAAGIDKQQALLDEIERVAQKVGRVPTSTDMDEHGTFPYANYTSYFESWDTALKQSGIDQSKLTSEMINTLQSLCDRLDRAPKSTELPEECAYSRYEFYSEFGSWDEALEAAGIDKEQALLDEIGRVAQKVGRVPTSTDMDEYGAYSASMYRSYFESWSTALEQSSTGENYGSGSDSSTQFSQSNGMVQSTTLHDSITESVLTIDDIGQSARLNAPIVIKCNLVQTDENERQAYTLQVEDIQENTCQLNTWTKHGLNIDWKEDHWYLLEEARGKVWEKNGTLRRRLSSTRDLTVTELGEQISEEAIQSAVERASKSLAETNTSTDNSKHSEDNLTDDDGTESSGILDEVMGEFDDGDM